MFEQLLAAAMTGQREMLLQAGAQWMLQCGDNHKPQARRQQTICLG